MSSRTQAILTRKNRINVLKRQKKRHQDRLKDINGEMTQLERECIKFLEAEGVERVSDAKNNVSIKETDVPVMQDFMTFYKYVRRQNAPELLTQKINTSAWRERDQKVPGVGTYTVKKLSITTRRGK